MFDDWNDVTWSTVEGVLEHREEGDPVPMCDACGDSFSDLDPGDDCSIQDGKYFCEVCGGARYESFDAEFEKHREAAEAFALEHCKVFQLPEFDLDVNWDSDATDGHSHESYINHCRHNYTNYESLLLELSGNRNSPENTAYYNAIKKRINDMIRETL